MTTFVVLFASFLTFVFALQDQSVFAQVRFRIAVLALPQCQNGIDDDGDTLVDFPDDSDCTSSSDMTESPPLANPPTVVCFASNTQGTTSDTMTWIAIPANGNGTYTYVWSGTDALTGTASSVNKTYATAGTKTASLIVTSGGLSSPATPCVNSILITNPVSPPSGGGGGGGGGGGSESSGEVPPKVVTPTPIKTPPTDIDDTPPLDSAPPSGGDGISECPIPTPQSTFGDYKDYLVCSDLITERVAEEHYEYEKYTPRKELLGVAVETALRDKDVAITEGLNHLTSSIQNTQIADTDPIRLFHFFDVGLEGQPDWIEQTVYKGVVLGLITTQNTLFRPNDHATRAEAFAMMMKAVCMNPDTSNYPTWEERVYDTARKSNITIRSWQDFEAQKTILRQELFVLASKLDIWRDVTGGCTPLVQIKPLPDILQPVTTPPTTLVPSLPSAPPESMPPPILSPVTTIISEQQPGTFVLIYENETEKFYSYRVKSGGIPDGVRLRYIQVFSFPQSLSHTIFIQDISGTEFAEDRWFLSGELIYVSVKK